ncbi:serine/threonine-protein kinase [Actinoplanes sp. NPDC089786]|uniref:serine/threonine-protein kinase n=1 Tax=Actinoplanes sp. NPDC089786 TaxID=3155185 RepID=UPI0034197368
MSTPLRTSDPTRLGDYELLGRLGAGGMGTVYLGRGADGRRVAVKTLRHEYAWDAVLRGRFRSEVNRLRQVPPFCTAAVLDADPDHEPPYLVVEYVSGPSLADEIRKNGPLGPDLLPGVIIGVTTALAAIHGAGVVHRDVKPTNVLLTLGGVKVIDFGIARPIDLTSEHTLTGQLVGTVEYMAPECFDTVGSAVSPAADIFAWGVLVAYAATGRTPFTAGTAAATAVRIATQPPDLGALSGRLRDLVGRALAKRPTDRPTARELLDTLLGTAPVAARPPVSRPVPPAIPRPRPPQLQRPTPRPAVRENPRHTRVFVVLMVLTGLLGTILTLTLLWVLDDFIS